MSDPPAKKKKFLNKKIFYQPNKKHYLEVGHKGFLATCNFNEKDCIRECYNILNQYANELYGVEDDAETNSNTPDEEKFENDISDELQKQISDTKQKLKYNTKRRFQAVDTGATNCVFIKTTLDDHKAVGERIINDISGSKQQKTRHILRLLPIEAVCKANIKDIINTAGSLCDKYFLKEYTTFSIIINKRFNNSINRNELIRELGELISSKNANNKVDLKYAKKSLIVEVIKGLCCLTVVDNYLAMKKYNLVELAIGKNERNKEVNNRQINSQDSEQTKV